MFYEQFKIKLIDGKLKKKKTNIFCAAFKISNNL